MSVKMLGSGAVPLILLVLCMPHLVVSVKSVKCPWEDPSLERWSDASTWLPNNKPVKNEEVKITKRMLMDESPPALGTLTIEAGAALIWDDQDNLNISTHYILIKGEFHIGSEDCKFDKKASIYLLGDNSSKHHAEGFGRKFIGVTKDGTLEMHGKNKTSWTSLSQTVKRPSELTCPYVYDHLTGPFKLERRKGVRVILWDTDGSVMDFKGFYGNDDTFANFFENVDNGVIIGIYSAVKLTDSNSRKAGLSKALNILGHTKTAIDTAGDILFFSFVGRKGDPKSFKEFLSEKKVESAVTKYLSVYDAKAKLVFQVAKSDTKQFFRVLYQSVAYPVLTLAADVTGWTEGDEVLVTSTDYDWEQAEIKRIMKCDECPKNKIRVNETFEYLHYGNFTFNVDERAEVAMLTRSIRIEGVMADVCPQTNEAEKELCKRFGKDTFGGHLKIHRGHKAARISGVELKHMGQQGELGSYPLHFHMCDNVTGMYLSQNSIHHSFSRCITVHGTHFLEVIRNVCFKHHGHGIFLEDAVEQNNKIKGNLVAGTMFGGLIMSDMNRDWVKQKDKEHCGDPSSYWITHPNNIVEDNVAAGGVSHGFTYMFSLQPLGPSKKRQEELKIPHDPLSFPLRFNRSKAHSYDIDGVFFDGRISHGDKNVEENGVHRGAVMYYPKVNGKPDFANMSDIVSFKCRRTAAWIKGGNIRLTKSIMADSREGFSGGTSLMDSGSIIDKCVFIGETENRGYEKTKVHEENGRKYTRSMSGVSIYQGPVIINNTFFDKFKDVRVCSDTSLSAKKCDEAQLVTRYATGITFKKGSQYPFMSSSFVQNVTFGYCDDTNHHRMFQGDDGQGDFKWNDGNWMVYVGDKTGSLTGTKNTAVVNDIPLYKGPECKTRPNWGKLLVCPYRYIKLKIKGSTGNLHETRRKEYPLVIWRTDPPYNEEFPMKGHVRNEYLLRTLRSYVIDFNWTASNSAFSRDYVFEGFGVEKEDKVRIGLCLPNGVGSFIVTMRDHPGTILKNNYTKAMTMKQLDEDETGTAFYHDKQRQILFFKIVSHYNDDNVTQQCPQGHCFKVKIELFGKDGNKPKFDEKRVCFEKYSSTIEDFVVNTRFPKVKDARKCHPRKRSIPKEYLPQTIWDQTFVASEEFTVPCPNFTPRTGVHQGCFMTSGKIPADQRIEEHEVRLTKTMSISFCVNRCYRRGYEFAALRQGKVCSCGHKLEGLQTNSDCNRKCTGDGKPNCGGAKLKDVDVWKTGI